MTFAATNGQQYTNVDRRRAPKGGRSRSGAGASTPVPPGTSALGTITSIIGGTLPGVTVNNPGGIGGLGAGVWISTSGVRRRDRPGARDPLPEPLALDRHRRDAATYDYWARTASARWPARW
jgi:hypothetical protein